MDMTAGHDVYGHDGRLLFLGFDSFYTKVVKKSGCFVCGSTPGNETSQVNEEHIVPLWLIRHADIASQSVTLMNGAAFMYGKYKMPICSGCNSQLGVAYEDKISQALKSGYDVFSDFFHTSSGYRLTYQWLSLVLLKLLLGDNRFARERDRSLGLLSRIGDGHMWDRHHHLLCVVRAGIVGGVIDPMALGSVFLIKAKDPMPFDLATFPVANAIKVQVGDIVLIGFLDDARFVSAQLTDLRRPFPVEMNSPQIAEFLIRMTTLAEHLKPRPQLFTEFTHDSTIIRVRRPRDVVFLSREEHAKLVGDRLYAYLLRTGLLALLPQVSHGALAEGKATFFPDVLGGNDWEG
jgi:hypothetical protein